jgi:hypothetical protein
MWRPSRACLAAFGACVREPVEASANLRIWYVGLHAAKKTFSRLMRRSCFGIKWRMKRVKLAHKLRCVGIQTERLAVAVVDLVDVLVLSLDGRRYVRVDLSSTWTESFRNGSCLPKAATARGMSMRLFETLHGQCNPNRRQPAWASLRAAWVLLTALLSLRRYGGSLRGLRFSWAWCNGGQDSEAELVL